MRKRIGIDVDGVLRDWVTQVIYWYKKCYPTHIILPYSHWQWELSKSMPSMTLQEAENFVFNTLSTEIFEQAPVIYESVDLVKSMIQLDAHDIVIVSAQRPGLEHHTYKWIGNNKINAKEIIMTNDKNTAKVDILLDDGIKFLKNHPNPVCFTQPWNKEWAGPRVKNMQEFFERYYLD